MLCAVMAYIVVPLLRKERRGIQNELGASIDLVYKAPQPVQSFDRQPVKAYHMFAGPRRLLDSRLKPSFRKEPIQLPALNRSLQPPVRIHQANL